MKADLDTNVGNRYSVLTMVFFIGYPLVDNPAMYLTRKVGPALWIGSIGLAWSVITIGQGFCHSWTALAVCRALLGLLEGGLVPGVLVTETNQPSPILHRATKECNAHMLRSCVWSSISC
jgi:MFS family permease